MPSVDKLENAGFIELAGERPVRGTVERTFFGVAKRFVVGEAALGGTEKGRAHPIARAALNDVLKRLGPYREGEEALMLVRGRARLTDESRDRLQASITEFLRDNHDETAKEMEVLAILTRPSAT